MHRLLILMLATTFASAQNHDEANYDEAKIPAYTLPPLLVCNDGSAVANSEQWSKKRRAEVLDLYRDYEFGHTPSTDDKPKFEVISVKTDALGGLAARKLVRITLPKYPQWPGIEMMLYLPNHTKAAPVFVGLSFGGNHAVSKETDIPLSTRWMRESKDNGIVDHRATEASRGTESSRWPLEMILKGGYALATAYYGDIEPDHPEGWKEGLRAAVSKDGANTSVEGQRLGCHRSLGLGVEPHVGLLRNRQRRRRPARCRHRPLTPWQNLSLGWGARRALWHRDQRTTPAKAVLLSPGATSAKPTSASPPASPIGSARPTERMRIVRMSYPSTSTCSSPSPRPERSTSLVPRRTQWADPHGEFLSGKQAGEVVCLVRQDRRRCGRLACRESTRGRLHCLPHPHRQTRCHRLRLGAVFEVR